MEDNRAKQQQRYKRKTQKITRKNVKFNWSNKSLRIRGFVNMFTTNILKKLNIKNHIEKQLNAKKNHMLVYVC